MTSRSLKRIYLAGEPPGPGHLRLACDEHTHFASRLTTGGKTETGWAIAVTPPVSK